MIRSSLLYIVWCDANKPEIHKISKKTPQNTTHKKDIDTNQKPNKLYKKINQPQTLKESQVKYSSPNQKCSPLYDNVMMTMIMMII